jgi:hypothetical protein
MDETRYAELKKIARNDNKILLILMRMESEEESEPSYLRELEKTDRWVHCDIAGHWREIENLTPGRYNRIALGMHFDALRHIYSEKNIGGNRRTSGHGTFEKGCEERGYSPRTVRGWIADYKAYITGAPTEAQKRSARQQRKDSALLAEARTSGSLAPEVRSLPKEDAPIRAHLRVLKSLDDMGGSLNDLQTATIALLETGVAEKDHLNLIVERCDRIRETLDVIDRLTKGKQTAALDWTTPEIAIISNAVN